MTTSALTMTGLILDMIGASLLAYELFLGYPRRNKLMIAEAKSQQLQRFFTDMDRIIDAYKVPIEEKETDKKKLRSDYQSDFDKLQEEIRKQGEGHQIKSFYVGIFGFLLLGIGFILQFLGAL